MTTTKLALNKIRPLTLIGIFQLWSVMAAPPETLSLNGKLLANGVLAAGQKVQLLGDGYHQEVTTEAAGDFTFSEVPAGLKVWIAVSSNDQPEKGWSTRPFFFATSETGYLIEDEHKQRKTSTKGLEIEVKGQGHEKFVEKTSNQSFQLRGGGAIRISGGSIVAGGNAGGAQISGKGTVEAGILRWVLQ
tara:strand:- start:2407 stop:2973 length:567 start_codon:yes stop_codon:yes gene_type:complete